MERFADTTTYPRIQIKIYRKDYKLAITVSSPNNIYQ